MKRNLRRLHETNVTLNDEQHEEMCSIVREISDEDFSKVLLEGSELLLMKLLRVLRSFNYHQNPLYSLIQVPLCMIPEQGNSV